MTHHVAMSAVTAIMRWTCGGDAVERHEEADDEEGRA